MSFIMTNDKYKTLIELSPLFVPFCVYWVHKGTKGVTYEKNDGRGAFKTVWNTPTKYL